jgi:hypothetical protein
MAAFLSRLAFAFAAVLIATIAVIGAVAFLCYAVFLLLAMYMPPPIAAVAAAVTLVLFAVIALLAGRSAVRTRRRKRPRDVPHPGGFVIEAIEALFGLDIPDLASKNPYQTTGVAFLLGILFGISPGLRRAASDFLRR